MIKVLDCIADNLFKSNTTTVNDSPGFQYTFPISSFCRLMKLASMGDFVYVCDLQQQRGIEFVVPFASNGLASVVVVADVGQKGGHSPL